MTNNFTCPNCRANLHMQQGFDLNKGYWTCTDCEQQLFGDDEKYRGMVRRFPNVVWHCDNCSAVLNAQDGFNDWSGEWACTECGRVSNIEEDEIVGRPTGAFFRRLGARN